MQFDLVTPEKQIASLEATYVDIPGSEGAFGVLDGHSPLLSTLNAGVIRVETAVGEKLFEVEGGFADVSATTVTILAEVASEVTA